MEKHKYNEKSILMVILCILVVLIIGLAIGIIVASVNRNNGNSIVIPVGADGKAEEGFVAGGTAPMGLDDEDDEEGEFTEEDAKKAAEWMSEFDEVCDYVYEMSFTDAMNYVEGKINEKDNPDDIFNMRLIKMNLMTNDGAYQNALQESENIKPEELSLWNQERYYNAMRYIYQMLGDEEKAQEYIDLFSDVNLRITGGASGAYE